MANLFPSTVSIDQGRTFTFTVQWTNDSGTPYDLTGYTANFALSNDYEVTPLLSLAVGTGITITALTGTIVVTATPTQTDPLTNNGYVAELMVTSGSGVETSLLKGYVACSSKVVL